MNKQQIENLEKKLREYHNSIPDFPIENKHANCDRILTLIMTFLAGGGIVLMLWLMYEVNKVTH